MLVADLLRAYFLLFELGLLRAAHFASGLGRLFADALRGAAGRVALTLLALGATAWFTGLEIDPLFSEPAT